MLSKGLFENLFRSHNKDPLHFVARPAGEVADDLVWESLLNLVQHLEPESIEDHRAYLHKLAGNTLIDHQPKLAVRERNHVEVGD